MLKAVIALIILNISLLAWGAVTPDTTRGITPLVEHDIPSLVLLPDLPHTLYRDKSTKLGSSCYSLGPFNNQESAQLVGKRIREYGLAFDIRSIKSMETLRYLVYLSPLDTQQEAEKIADDLRKNNIENVSVITDGPYENAISIGFYSNFNRAKRETEHVRYLGYDARHSEEKSPLEVYWVDYDEPFGSNTPVIKWSRSIDPTTAAQRIPRTCD